MNLEEKRKRLKSLLEENIKVGNIGTAIAIAGSWGVGKTFFWNSFRDEVNFKKKYVYVSLFGLESLGDLKTHIYSNIENNHSALEIPRWIRGLPSILKDTRVSQFGVSASAKVFDSLMFNQVKDAIICFDDFERMSNKLDIKDVMGLANQLKLEKNCQIILILDEDKAEGDNKKKYAEYKEKLIDETIIINSVEPLIRANAQDMDAPLVDLMVEFADKLKIHNFRFFQKVIKLYRQFIEKLPDEVAYLTKHTILVRILHGYLIENFGEKFGISWQDFNTNNEFGMINFDQSEWGELKKKTYASLQSVSEYFVMVDRWATEYKKWFEQRDSVDTNELHNLANSELISEKNNHIKEKLNHLMHQWRNLQVDQEYCEELFQLASKSIEFNDLESLDGYCYYLKKFGRNDLSKQLKKAVKEHLVESLQHNIKSIKDELMDASDIKTNLFYRYVRLWCYWNPKTDLSPLSEILLQFLRQRTLVRNAKNSFLNAVHQDWENLIFGDMLNDSELKNTSKINLLRGILLIAQKEKILPQIQQGIEAMLQNKIDDSTDVSQQNNIEFVMSILKEEGLL
jgi:hypothetical protein